MTTRTRAFALAFILLAAPACLDLDFTGLEGLDDYASELAASAEPSFIQCQSVSLTVGEQTACHAFNQAGTHLVHSSIAPLIWESDTPTIATITLDGLVTAASVGTATIRARGPNGSIASLAITVEALP